MDIKNKTKLFIATVVTTLVTVWFSLPAVMNIWTEKATMQNAYLLGFTLGAMTTMLWIVLLYQWRKY